MLVTMSIVTSICDRCEFHIRTCSNLAVVKPQELCTIECRLLAAKWQPQGKCNECRYDKPAQKYILVMAMEMVLRE